MPRPLKLQLAPDRYDKAEQDTVRRQLESQFALFDLPESVDPADPESPIPWSFWRPSSNFPEETFYPLVPWLHGFLNGSFAVNRDHYVPFVLGQTVDLDRIAMVVTGGAANAKTRVGLYHADQTTLKPTTLIVDGGEFDTSTNGLKSATIAQTLERGIAYCYCYANGTAAPITNILGVTGSLFNAFPFLGVQFNLLPTQNFRFGWYVSRTYDALVADATGSTFNSLNQAPVVYCRVAAAS